MKKEIIIARHNEDISWTEPYKEYLKIYDKGEKIEGFSSIQLPNIGRESHTYLHHIVKNYDNLADYTIFLQAKPQEHSDNFYEKLNEFLDNDYDSNFMWVSTWMAMSNLNAIDDPHRPILANYRYGYNKVFDGDKLDNFIFGAGALFCVSKERILSRPKSFYENALNLFFPETGEDVCQNLLIDDYGVFNPEKPVIAYHFERFWGLIFDV
jgi:hypothetical protein